MQSWSYSHIQLVIHRRGKMFHVKHFFKTHFVKTMVKVLRNYPQINSLNYTSHHFC